MSLIKPSNISSNLKSEKILMAVFNPIDFDGRVKRSVETLSQEMNLTLFCPAIGSTGDLDLPESVVIKRALMRWKVWPTVVALAVFWLQFIYLSFIIRPKIIYAHDYYLSFPGLIAAKLTRALSIYDAHELIIPDPNVSMSIRNKFFYLLEKISIQSYDLVFSANEERSKLMKSHYELQYLPTPILNVSKPTLTNNCSDLLERFPQLQRDDYDCFVVYMGDVSLKRGLAQVIDSFQQLPSNFSLIIIGSGTDYDSLEKRFNASEIKNRRVRMLGSVPQLLIQDLLNLCDIGLVIYSMEGLNNYYCSPNKIYEYTQAGLPVVATAQPPLVNIIEKYKIGKIAGEDGLQAGAVEFATAIKFVFSNYNELVSNIPFFLNKNTLESQQNILRSTFFETLKRSNEFHWE